MPEYPLEAFTMSQAIIGRWGKNLAVRVPLSVAKAAGLSEGEKVDVEAVAGDIVIRRASLPAEARRQAEEAAAEIRAESTRYRLGGLSIRDLLSEGRRG
jgi:antitoxin component of MazEF toxin-antitoxin module